MIRSLALVVVVALLAACGSGPEGSAQGAPTPTPDISGQVIEDFYHWATDPKSSYASVQTAEVQAAGQNVSLVSDYEFEAGKARATVRGRAAGKQLRFAFILIDDFAYLRQSGNRWQQVAADALQTSGPALDAFEFLMARTDLEWVGPKDVDGRQLYELHNSEPLEYRTPAAGIQDPTVTVTQLVVLVTARGLPMQMQYHMEIDGELPDGRSYFGEGDVRQTFRQHGETFGIRPPASFD